MVKRSAKQRRIDEAQVKTQNSRPPAPESVTTKKTKAKNSGG